MSIALSALRTRLNNDFLNDSTSIWSTTVKDDAINAGIARLYPFNFLVKHDTTQTTDIDSPTFLYTTPSDCEQLCRIYIANVSTDVKLLVTPWTWYRATTQVEIPYIEKYNDAKTITMVYEAAHPQLATDNDTFDPQMKEDAAIEAVLYYAALRCWRSKERQNIGEMEFKDYAFLIEQDNKHFQELLYRCSMPREIIVSN